MGALCEKTEVLEEAKNSRELMNVERSNFQKQVQKETKRQSRTSKLENKLNSVVDDAKHLKKDTELIDNKRNDIVRSTNKIDEEKAHNNMKDIRNAKKKIKTINKDIDKFLEDSDSDDDDDDAKNEINRLGNAHTGQTQNWNKLRGMPMQPPQNPNIYNVNFEISAPNNV